MIHARALTAMAVLGLASAQAQTPFFNDGPALGGSQVFSEGLNPLGNAARLDQPSPQPIIGFSYLKGDERSQDNASALGDLGSHVPGDAAFSDALRKLADSRWGQRTRAYGFIYLDKTIGTSYTHEEHSSLVANVDTANLDVSTMDLNTTRADIRRSVVDRAAIGVGSASQGLGTGVSFRVERWKLGAQMAAINPGGTSLRALASGPDPLAFSDTSLTTTTVALDFGFTMDLADGVRLGGNINRLNAKRLWDVEEKPQGRVGLQMDIGTLCRFSLETDVNATMRMPFPVKQRTSAASLRIAASQTMTLLLGAERKKFADAFTTRGGATLQIHLTGWQLSLGMQYSKDHPLTGYTALFQ